jgi:FkbM family methyltransferase
MKKVIAQGAGMEQVFFVPDGGECVVDEVFIRGGYDCFLGGVNLSILDIGGNVGAFALWAVTRFPGSCVRSYEPVKEVFDCLMKNTSSYPMIEARHFAVSTSEELTIKVNKDRFHTSGNGFSHASTDDVEERVVPTIHPREIVGEFDIVKVDTEGAEVDIIENMDLSKTSIVMVEIHSRADYERLSKYFEKIGFYVWSIQGYHCKGTGEFVFANSNHWNPNMFGTYLEYEDFNRI